MEARGGQADGQAVARMMLAVCAVSLVVWGFALVGLATVLGWWW